MPLADWIKGNRWALTDPIADKFSDKLPFLFKARLPLTHLQLQIVKDHRRNIENR